MKKYISLLTVALLFVLPSIFIIFTGCSSEDKKPERMNTEQTNPKTPKDLTEIEDSIEEIFKTLDKKNEESPEKSEVITKTTIETKDEQKETAEKTELESEKKVSQEIKKETPDDKAWKSIDKKSEALHEKWNNLEPEAIKSGVDKNNIDGFSNALNSLTLHVEAKDQMSVLLAANQLYGVIPEFMNKFDDKVPPDLRRTVYYIREAKYNSLLNKWEDSKLNIENAKSHFTVVKGTLKKDSEKLGDKTEFSIKEMEKVVLMNNLTLAKIKSELVIDNLKKLKDDIK